MDATRTGHEYRSQEKTREKTTRHVTPTAKKEPLHKEKQKKIRILGSKIRKQGEPPRAERKKTKSR